MARCSSTVGQILVTRPRRRPRARSSSRPALLSLPAARAASPARRPPAGASCCPRGLHRAPHVPVMLFGGCKLVIAFQLSACRRIRRGARGGSVGGDACHRGAAGVGSHRRVSTCCSPPCRNAASRRPARPRPEAPARRRWRGLRLRVAHQHALVEPELQPGEHRLHLEDVADVAGEWWRARPGAEDHL